MNEEDTFRVLKRTPINDLLNTFRSLPYLERQAILVNEVTREVWLNKYGWTIAEYQEARFPSTIE